MKTVQSIAVLIPVFVICTTNALSFDDYPNDEADLNSTAVAAIKEQIARRKAYEAFLLLSPYPRNDCLDTFAPPDNNFSANELMDMGLEILRNLIRERNMDRVDFPDFEESFEKKIGFITVKGSFQGKEGWVESTLSIKRKDNARVQLNGTTVTLDSALGLEILRLGMNYKAKISFLGTKGKLDAYVLSNTVSFSGGLDYASGTCKVFINSLALSELGKIDIHVTGLGALDWLYSKIVNWVTSRLHDNIKNTIEKTMRKIIEKELDKIKCPSPLRL